MGSWCLHSFIVCPFVAVLGCRLIFVWVIVGKLFWMSFEEPPIFVDSGLFLVKNSTFQHRAQLCCLIQLFLRSPDRWLLRWTVKNVCHFVSAHCRRLKMLSWQWVRIWDPISHLAQFLNCRLLRWHRLTSLLHLSQFFWHLSLLFFAIAIIIIKTFIVLWSVVASLSCHLDSNSVTLYNLLRWR